MKNKITVVSLLLLVLVMLSSCKPEPPPPPPPPPPPEPTAEEYYQQLRTLMGNLLLSGIEAQPDSTIPELLTQLNGRKAQLSASENGRGALQMLSRDVEEAIRVSREQERWRKISALCRVYLTLHPDNTRFEKTREYADLMLQRPVLKVTGFMELDNELYVFIDLFDPKTGETKAYKVREGEEFHAREGEDFHIMRLVKIIGNQYSVEVEYLPLNYSWECIGPKKRDVLGPNIKKQ